MKTNNILFNPRTRKETKFWYHLPFWFPYYELESISLKEKIYTMRYRLEKYGYYTQGEHKWVERIMKLDYEVYREIDEQFKKDYIEYLTSEK